MYIYIFIALKWSNPCLWAVEEGLEWLFGKSITVCCFFFLCSYYWGSRHTAWSTCASSSQWIFLEYHFKAWWDEEKLITEQNFSNVWASNRAFIMSAVLKQKSAQTNNIINVLLHIYLYTEAHTIIAAHDVFVSES